MVDVSDRWCFQNFVFDFSCVPLKSFVEFLFGFSVGELLPMYSCRLAFLADGSYVSC